jgi:dTDP-4-amino-4,6-dideoxygalactose transaminase
LGNVTESRLALFGGDPVVRPGEARLWPVLTPADYEAVRRVLDRGVLSGRGAPETNGLEAEWASFVGARFCLATNSGTSALHIALAAAGVGPGDEVIVPALSFIATAQAVLHQGATPVFVDIDPATYTIDPERLEAAVTSRTKAVVPVHLHGLPAAMDAINTVAAAHGLVVIEDAAQAHGAFYRGRRVGTLGAMAAFSLNSTKNLPAGEGGLFVTDDREFLRRAEAVRFDGIEPDRDFEWDPTHPLDGEAGSLASTIGWMYLPGELTAALARSQLRRLDQTNAAGQVTARRLSDRLAGLPGVEPPAVPSDRSHVFHKYRVRLRPEALGLDSPPLLFRDLVLQALRAEGVEAVLWQTVPLPDHPLFQNQNGGADCPEARRLLDSSLIIGSQSFPLFAQSPELADAYAEAFEKIWTHLPELVTAGVRQHER